MDVQDVDVSLPHSLKLLVCSWNVGNAAPPKVLDAMIPPRGGTYDIIVMGVQECTYHEEESAVNIEEQEEYERRSKSICEKEREKNDFMRIVQTQVGSDFYNKASITLWQMRLVVFVRHSHGEAVSGIEVVSEATGIGNVMGNKGGLAAKIEIYGTTLCFVR